jgi:hypothetical protein
MVCVFFFFDVVPFFIGSTSFVAFLGQDCAKFTIQVATTKVAAMVVGHWRRRN